jgi:hypothetical protein
MKKFYLFLTVLATLFLFVGCTNKEKLETTPTETEPVVSDTDSIDEPTVYDFDISLPSTELLTDATDIKVLADAPELMIIEAVLDTTHYYHYETMSGFEYIKVFNNSEEDYNLKNHRIVLANPTQGQNIENPDSLKGNEILVTGMLFMGWIDDDFVIPSLSTGLIWLKPYYWTAGSGSNAFNKPFSSIVIHKDNADQQGAISQTNEDFRTFWNLDSEDVPVYGLTNMGLVGKKSDGGTEELYPIFSPGSGSLYTHLNSSLIRSIEIQKFNDQEGTASVTLLNKYSELSTEKQADPDFVYGKKAFNVMEIKDNDEVIDGYFFENAWKYFDPIIRINFSGRIDTTKMTAGQTHVDFTVTSNPGIQGWDNTIGLQFRPPLVGERIMQWQLPLREFTKFETYMAPTQFNLMRFSSENLPDYRFINKTIKLAVDPTQGLEFINWRSDELQSEGRLSSAAPGSLKIINITRP